MISKHNVKWYVIFIQMWQLIYLSLFSIQYIFWHKVGQNKPTDQLTNLTNWSTYLPTDQPFYLPSVENRCLCTYFCTKTIEYIYTSSYHNYLNGTGIQLLYSIFVWLNKLLYIFLHNIHLKKKTVQELFYTLMEPILSVKVIKKDDSTAGACPKDECVRVLSNWDHGYER